jgi:hypothetical protein
MMSQRGGSQDKFIYSFHLDDHVPRDHLLRGIDRFFVSWGSLPSTAQRASCASARKVARSYAVRGTCSAEWRCSKPFLRPSASVPPAP